MADTPSLEVSRGTAASGSVFDFQEREREKQAFRDEDERAVLEGRMSLRDLEEKNTLLRADRAVPQWHRAKPL